jgi:hypothetical protein
MLPDIRCEMPYQPPRPLRSGQNEAGGIH